MTLCFDSLNEFSRRALLAAFTHARTLRQAPLAVDCTAGNGHDTLFLASAVGSDGKVWAFDVQEEALAATRKRLTEAETRTGVREGESVFLERAEFVHAGHETLADVLPAAARGNVWGAMFNLGYLPGSDKTVVTETHSTLAALNALVPFMHTGGIISVHGYTGHEGGQSESDAVADWFRALPWEEWRVVEYSFANKKQNREILFLAELTTGGEDQSSPGA